MKTKNRTWIYPSIMGVLLMSSITLKTSAQNYIISFAATGAATTIDSVQVENITKGTSLTIIGGDSLHLTGTAGIIDLNVIEEDMRIYPNPMQGQAELSFYAKKTGNARLIIYDISGKGVLQISNAFFQGIQMCRITGLKQGIYFVNIIGENYLYTAKLISLNTSQSEAKIEYVGIEKTDDVAHQLQRTKSISIMSYTTGDTLVFTGYSGTYSSIITDVPTSSNTITFIFTSIATVTTDTVTLITTSTATSGGSVTSDGGATVTAKGVCWSTTTNPVATGNHTTDGSGIGTFTSNITSLTASTVYYVRAYATNSVGTAYGNELTFTTAIPITVPILSTTTVSSITATTANSGGNITSDGGAAVTAKGVCWSTTTNPVATGNHTTNGTGTGIFTSNITGLSPSTTYYVRAYATNSVGTAYGNELTFTTAIPITVPVLSTTTVSSITATTANSGGNITSDGGATVTVRGVCWSSTTNPVATGNHTTNGTGTGIFTSNITGLSPSTTYYVRAYATNSVGTAYGNQLFFTTDSSTTSFTCGNTLNISHTIGVVAPITKSVAYGTVTTSLSGASKCWITQNLGSSNQATSATDASDAAAGWYWQFNRKQGYKNGTTPTPAWTITTINETSDWLAANDPCTIELGTGWRIPTYTEWLNADANGAWSNYTHAYNSVLKLHAGGWLYNSTGALYHRGGGGRFWSSTQNNAINGWYLIFSNSLSSINNYSKAGAFAVRCIRD